MQQELVNCTAKLVLPNKVKVDGSLTLTPTQLIWEPEELSQAQPVSITIKGIKDFQRAKNNPLIRIASGDGTSTLECLSFGERDSLVDHINYVKDDGRSGAGTGSSQVSGPHAAAKQALLDADSALMALWRQLVQGGVLSDAEFWGSRQNLLTRAAPPPKQRTAFASQMIASVVPSEDGKSKQVKMKLTPELIQQLFQQEPHMKAAFEEQVPHKLDQASFWRKYGEYLVLKASAKSKARLRDLDEQYALFQPQPEAGPVPGAYRAMDPGVNLATDYYDNFSEGYGNLHQAGKESAAGMTASGQANDIMSAINRHAGQVLQGPMARSTGAEPRQQERRRMDSALDDLRQDTTDAHAPLLARPVVAKAFFVTEAVETVQSHRQLFERRAAPAASPVSEAEALEAAREAVQQLCQQGGQLCMQPSQAATALHGHTGDIHRATTAAGRLPKALEQRMRQQALTVNELLRHLWGSMPASNPARQQRAQRMVDELGGRQQALAQLQREQPQHTASLQALAAPLLASIQAAATRMEEEKIRLGQLKQSRLMSR